jgi:hypothetical protein
MRISIAKITERRTVKSANKSHSYAKRKIGKDHRHWIDVKAVLVAAWAVDAPLFKNVIKSSLAAVRCECEGHVVQLHGLNGRFADKDEAALAAMVLVAGVLR